MVLGRSLFRTRPHLSPASRCRGWQPLLLGEGLLSSPSVPPPSSVPRGCPPASDSTAAARIAGRGPGTHPRPSCPSSPSSSPPSALQPGGRWEPWGQGGSGDGVGTSGVVSGAQEGGHWPQSSSWPEDCCSVAVPLPCCRVHMRSLPPLLPPLAGRLCLGGPAQQPTPIVVGCLCLPGRLPPGMDWATAQ